jgi:C_GCAxxG_C_C family probable redox protein
MGSNPSKEDILNNLDQKVDEYFQASGNCAQATFLALQEQFGLEGDQILKALTPFPGLAFRGKVCGVVVACVMALGLKHGRDTIDDWPGYIRSIPPVKAFYQRFENEVGSILCGEVLGSVAGDTFESTEPAETKRWLDAGCLEKCSEVLSTGVRLTAEILLDK